MSAWSWVTGPLGYKDKCVVCSKPLRTGAVVKWTDVSLYHVGCLLDHLASLKPEAKDTGCGAVTGLPWGVLGIGGSGP